MCRYHSISEHLLGIGTLTRMPSYVAVVWRCFRWRRTSWRRAKNCHMRLQNLTLKLQKLIFGGHKLLQMTQNIYRYIIKGLLHWYRWILSLVGISTDARKLPSFDIPTRDNIHRYQCNNPISYHVNVAEKLQQPLNQERDDIHENLFYATTMSALYFVNYGCILERLYSLINWVNYGCILERLYSLINWVNYGCILERLYSLINWVNYGCILERLYSLINWVNYGCILERLYSLINWVNYGCILERLYSLINWVNYGCILERLYSLINWVNYGCILERLYSLINWVNQEYFPTEPRQANLCLRAFRHDKF